MNLQIFILLGSVLLFSCNHLEQNSRKIASVANCPVKGSTQVSIDEAYVAMANGTNWGMFKFQDPLKNIEDYRYADLTDDTNYFPNRGAFRLSEYPGLSSCFRQIHLIEQIPGTDTNVWSGYVYIERCAVKNKFTSKKEVLEYAGEDTPAKPSLRTRQVLSNFFFKEENGSCLMVVSVNPLDELEGRYVGVQSNYEFKRR